MSKTEKPDHMGEALAEARLAAAADEVPVGAVLVDAVGGQVLARAHNRVERDADPTAHAEMLAIREASVNLGLKRLTAADLYVTLEPCPMCAGAMVHARIQRLVYGCADPKAGGVESLYRISTDARLNHQIETHAGVRASECRHLLQTFFRERRT